MTAEAKVERLLVGARRRQHCWLPIVARCTGCGRLTVSRLRTDRWRVRQWPVAVTWAEVDAQAERELTAKFGPCSP